MGVGTKYTDKEGLITSIISKVFSNRRFLVTADKVQTAFRDIIESLWNKSATINTLIIDDTNVSEYVQDYGTKACQYLINIPAETTIISIETTTTVNPCYGIASSTAFANGHKITVIGNLTYAQPVYDDTTLGRFTTYLYTYFAGVGSSNGSPYNISGTTTCTYAYQREALQEFMYWNGVWYYKGY